MRKITDKQARGLADGKTYSEKVGSKGAGSLLLIGRKQIVTAYYRYTEPSGERLWIDLGSIGGEITLAKARERCTELALLKKDHPHLKSWMEEQQRLEATALRQAEIERESQNNLGTLSDLLADYTNKLYLNEQSSASIVDQSFKSQIIEKHPSLLLKPAKDITPQDISSILKPISGRGAKVGRNRMRANLHAAFSFGAKYEYDETRKTDKSYQLIHNPVSLIPMLREAEKVGERTLNNDELVHFYKHIHLVENVSEQMADFVRFLIQIAGQRPLQVLRVPWKDYDLTQGTMVIQDTKGRGGSLLVRRHIVPLSPGAILILKKQKQFTGTYNWPFTSKGKTHYSIDSVKNVFRRFLASDYAVLDGERMDTFTARDIRRTAKNIMIRAKIPREQRNLLHNHAQTGVDATHYGNDPWAYLPEKITAMQLYTEALDLILRNQD